jgi:hypothetical protein
MRLLTVAVTTATFEAPNIRLNGLDNSPIFFLSERYGGAVFSQKISKVVRPRDTGLAFVGEKWKFQ